MTVKSKIAVIIAVCVTLFAGVTAEAEDYADLVEWVMTSMVYIQTDKSTGSGFFVSENDDILTNYHVIKDAQYIIVVPYGCEPVEALVKDFDAERDIVLLKAKEIRSSLIARMMVKPYLTISNTLPRIGEAVLAIGNPRGLSGTVSDGIVSAIRQGDNNLWVQFTAPVSPGSSGGALINTKGEIVGMPTWIRADAGSQNLNFAIASPVLSRFLSYAINQPARAWRPIQAQPKTVQRPQPKPEPKTKRSKKSAKKGSGIPLPDAKGFLVHKWGCSVESVRRYVSSPLVSVGNTGTIYTTGKSFKAFYAKISTIVYYCFTTDGKLDSVMFEIKDKRSNVLLQSIITRELSELYGISPDEKYVGEQYLGGKIHIDGYISRFWRTKGFSAFMSYDDNGNLFLSFSPMPW